MVDLNDGSVDMPPGELRLTVMFDSIDASVDSSTLADMTFGPVLYPENGIA